MFKIKQILKINILFFFFIILNAKILFADKNETQMSKSKSKNQITVGTELDALPYLSGGYYGSIFLGYNQFRFRTIITKAFPPKFATPDGFEDYELDVYAVIVDYFFDKNTYLEGFWIGAGVEFWDNEFKNKNDGTKGSFKNQTVTVGGGYTWNFYKNFFLNPWVAGHLIVSGDKEKQIGKENCKLNQLTGEISLKLGWHF